MCAGELIVGGAAEGFGVLWIWVLILGFVFGRSGRRERMVFFSVLGYGADSLESLLAYG